MTQAELVAALDNEFTGIIGFSELLVSSHEQVQERASEVLAAAERAVAFSRALSTRLERILKQRRCSVNETITETLPELRRIAGRDVEVILRLSDGLEPVIIGRDEMQSLLKLVVSESVQAMGGLGRIVIRTFGSARGAGDDRIHLTIQDTASDVAAADARWHLVSTAAKGALSSWDGHALLLREVGAGVRFNVESGYGTTLTVVFPTHPDR